MSGNPHHYIPNQPAPVITPFNPTAGIPQTSFLEKIHFRIIYLAIYLVYFIGGLAMVTEYCYKPLSAWSITMGAAGIVMIASHVYAQYLYERNGETDDWFGFGIPIVLGLFIVAWMIVGSVWIFDGDVSNPACDSTLFEFSLAMVSIGWLAIIAYIAGMYVYIRYYARK